MGPVIKCFLSTGTGVDKETISGPVHVYTDIFLFHLLFLPDSSTRGVFKSNSPVYAHPMAPGFTLDKLGLHVVKIFADRAKSLELKISGFVIHVIELVADLYFSTLESGLKISGFAAEFAGCVRRKLSPERKRCGFKC